MRLKVINNPKQPRRILVVDAETGDVVSGVSRITMVADGSTHFEPVVTIEVEVDFNVDVAHAFRETKDIAGA